MQYASGSYSGGPLEGDIIPGWIGLGLYTLLMVAGIYLFVNLLRSQRKTLYEFTVPKFFHICLFAFIVVRMTWIVIRMTTGKGNPEYITNRLALLLFFTAYALVVFHWADQFRQTLHDAQKLSPITRLIYGFIVALIWLFQIIIGALYLSSEEDSTEGTLLYNINTVGIAFLNLILAVGFLVYGMRWYYLARVAPDDYVGKKKEIIKIMVLTTVFVFCFVVRVFMWLYRPVSGHGALVPETMWLPLSYYLPELPPSVIQLYIIEESNFKAQEISYIQNLYSNSDDDEEGMKKSLSGSFRSSYSFAFRNPSV